MANMTAYERCRHFGVSEIRGMAYMPGPSNYSKGAGPGHLYEDSDFYSNIFEELWAYKNPMGAGARGRQDLFRFHDQLGINFIHCYDWAKPISQNDENGHPLKLRQHVTFLKVCDSLGMRATIPVSNWSMREMRAGNVDMVRENFQAIIAEVYDGSIPPDEKPIPGCGMWKIFNESDYDNSDGKNAERVVDVMQWIAEWEDDHHILDQHRLPVMICTSFADTGGTDPVPSKFGASYLKEVRDIMLSKGKIGSVDADQFWNDRIVFATNPQNPANRITTFLEDLLPGFWKKNNITAPPVMFTELGSNVEQAGGTEEQQANVLSGQIEASKPGTSEGMMLGPCVFLNEERPWEKGGELTFGIMKFGEDTSWPQPKQNYQAETQFPVWDPKGWYWGKPAQYPVEQQRPKPNYQSVAGAWGKR